MKINKILNQINILNLKIKIFIYKNKTNKKIFNNNEIDFLYKLLKFFTILSNFKINK